MRLYILVNVLQKKTNGKGLNPLDFRQFTTVCDFMEGTIIINLIITPPPRGITK